MPIYEFGCRRVWGGKWIIWSCPPIRSHRGVHAAVARQLRRLVSRFGIAGGKAVDDAALRSRPRDFLDRPERFGEAMRAVSERTGVKTEW